MRTRGQASTVADTALIATTFDLDESKLHLLLDAPTTDLVKDFLLGLTHKAQDLDSEKADKLRHDIEVENTIRNHEAKSKALRSSLTKTQKELEEQRNAVTSLETARAQLQSQVDSLKSNSSDSSSEVDALKSQIGTLEASNRDTLSLLESKSAAHDSLADELTAQHQKIVALRRDVSALEDKNQSLENAASSLRFREQGLLQEVDLLKRNIDWHEQELKTRSEESSKFRKEKNARIQELQRANEDATSQIEALKRTENALRERLDELSQKADDAFAKIQKMQEAAIDAESAFKTELESARRLADLQRQSAETARARLQDLEANLDQVKDAAADEIGQLQAEIETERVDKEAAETRLAELELEVEQLQTAQATLRAQSPAPGTPPRSVNGYAAVTPVRAASPFSMTPGTARSKGMITNTQLVAELSAVRARLEAAERRNDLLTQEFNDVLNEFENRAPEQDDFRQDKERMEAEVVEMSGLLDAALADRDAAAAEARRLEGESHGFAKECNVLRQQLRDLSAQIKILLVEMQARDQGLDMLDAAGSAQLRLLANGDVDDQVADQTSAGALITQRLLLFRNVTELQEQNMQLLKLNRGLADQMEGDEARAREAKQADSLRELEDIKKKADRYEDEIRSLKMQTESIKSERDMFRRMMSHRGPLPTNPDIAQSMFGQSIQADGPPMTPGRAARSDNGEQDGDGRQVSEYVKLVKELQTHVDTIRREATTDHGILRQQVDSLAREKSDLQSEIARSSGQITLAHERYDMLQKNYRMLQGENGELQKRTQVLSENAAKQDMRTQQVAEELVDAKAMAESMRAETANLKAEKELWRSIEGRLSEDNRQLMDERSRLNKMLADLQSLQNEREHADAENRRRLQARIDTLESDLSTVRKKLEQETEESKKAHLRREYEQDQSKTRIDDLIKSLSDVREELVAAKTTRDQLQTRVDEMKIDLRNAEERAQALQPRPTSGGPTAAPAASAEGELTREQELGVEVADLKRDLEITRGELENAKAEIEQYKSISQAAEEELQSLNDTNQQYREDTDRLIAEKEGVIQQLEQRIEDINSELTTSNSELSDLRTQHEQAAILLEAQKTTLEGDLARLQDECERQTEKAKMYQQDLKAQAEIAQQAQQSYEDELVKHADAAKLLQSVRTEYNALRTEVASIRAEAEAAKTSLSLGQDKWSELKDQYEKELHDIRVSRDDLKSQNKLLHEQLESVGSQISALHQHRAETAGDDQPTTAENAGSKLQEVITYLRREKEIVDVQYELAMQESKRTKQQLDYVQTQLDETRLKLSEEQRQRTENESNAASHTKLLETINELNLYRESSATLRQESRQAQAKLLEKAKEIEELTEQILPLQSKIAEVQSELEMKEGELKLLQEDRDRWRERTQNIISKYDRVDPAEIEAMKTKIVELEAEKETLLAKQQELQQELEGFPEQLEKVQNDAKAAWEEQKGRIVEQAKKRSREQAAKIKELTDELRASEEAKTKLSEDLAAAQTSLEEAISARDEAISAKEAADAELEIARTSAQDITGDNAISAAVQDDTAPVEEGQIEDVVAANGAEQDVTELEAKVQAAEANAQEQAELVATLQGELETLQTTIESQAARIAELEAQSEGQGESQELTDLRQELSALKEKAATATAADTSADHVPVVDVSSENPSMEHSVAEQVASQVAEQVAQLRQELEQQHEASKQDLEAKFQERSQNMKQMLNQKLRESREKAKTEVREEVRLELVQEHSAELEALKQQHAQELATLKEQHEAILARVTLEGAQAIQQAKADANGAPAENGAPAAAAEPFSIESITDEQARELVAKNEVIRGIIKRSAQKKVDEEKAKLKDDHEQEIAAKVAEAAAKLAEEHQKTIETTAATAQEDNAQAITKAVNLETMKQKAKLGMAEGQARTAKAKLEIVETAAKETPQRPVGEVWELAKNAKPAPVVAAKPGAVTAPAVNASPKPKVEAPVAVASPAPAVAATPAVPDDDAAKKAAREARFGTPTATPSTTGSFGKPSFGAPSAQAQTGGFGKPSFGAPSVPTAAPAPTAATTDAAEVKQEAGAATTTASSGLPRAGGSMLPRGGAGRGRGIPVPAAANNASQIGRGQSALPRGGASIRGNAGRGRGALNAGASQFVPGQQGAKRPHEGGDNQGDGKRIRGGGPSA